MRNQSLDDHLTIDPTSIWAYTILMVLICLLLAGAELPLQPPGFPELTEEFNQWQEYHPLLRPDISYEQPAFWRTHNLGPFEDTSLIPYAIFIPYYTDIWPRGDTSFGQVNYYDARLPDEGRPFDQNVVMVRWFVHTELEPGLLIESYLLADPNMELTARYVAYERGDPQLLTIDDYEGYRKRVRWWSCSADASFHITGSVTYYLVVTPTRDFHITCLTTSYEFHDERLSPEVEEQLGNEPRISSWPDSISELERAVEQSFRVKG